MSTEPVDFTPSASGVIEFEPVEPVVLIQQAAKAPVDETLDNDPLSAVFGQKKGSKPAAGDHMLAGTTIDWLIAFPMEARPKALCEKYPHVANRLAGEWRDAARVRGSLQALVDDARWGSAGYPALVQGELNKLLARLG